MHALRLAQAMLFVCLLLAPSASASEAMSVAVGVYRPEYPDNLSSLDAYERSAGRPIQLVHWFALWGGWKAAFNPADLESVRQRGSTPMITWEPWSGTRKDGAWNLQSAILSGASDAYIHAWARGLTAYGGPVLLRFAQEMHDQTYPWSVGINGNTPSDYVAAWRYVHTIFYEEGASNVQWVWNPNTMPGAPREHYQGIYRALYPGDDAVDWFGLDIYNGGSDLPTWGGSRSFADALGAPYAALQDLAPKPVVLAEVGSAEDGGQKATWINAAFADLEMGRFPAVRALVWFDVDKEERWGLHSSDATLASWTAALRSTPPQ
jgi:beta-mannanase